MWRRLDWIFTEDRVSPLAQWIRARVDSRGRFFFGGGNDIFAIYQMSRTYLL